MEHTKHIWRALLILLVLGAAAVVGREAALPESFGLTGHFRHDSIYEYRAMPLRHGVDELCGRCHKDQYKRRNGGKHATVPCETCHAPVTVHAKGKEKIADMPMNKTYKLCAYCHRKLEARPGDFPQVDLREHLVDQDVPVGDKIPSRICGNCHPPHDPLSE